jgi:prepilin-type processing-associated H-X9-DG protein/prepilin-type N-terminal cleavage/methylation domain-containing protein
MKGTTVVHDRFGQPTSQFGVRILNEKGLVMNHRDAHRGGFTLVELLVVIGIIAVLLGILLPVLNKVRQQANFVKCQSNLRQFGVGFQTYANDFKGAIPWEGFSDGNRSASPVGPWNDPWLWFNALPPLTGVKSYYDLQQLDSQGKQSLATATDNNIFVCPSAGPAIADAADIANGGSVWTSPDGCYMVYGNQETQDGTATGTPTVPQYLQNPPLSTASGGVYGAVDQRKFYMCYVFNSKLNDTINAANPNIIEPKLSQCEPSAEVPLLVKKMMAPSELQVQSNGFNPTKIDLMRCKTTWTRFAARHNNGGNLLFADGHVGYFNREELVPNAGTSTSGDVTGKVPTTSANAAWNIAGKITWDPFQTPAVYLP